MRIQFTIETPFALPKEALRELEQWLKKRVMDMINAYGVWHIDVTVKPRGAPEREEETKTIGPQKKMWFEEELEKEEEL